MEVKMNNLKCHYCYKLIEGKPYEWFDDTCVSVMVDCDKEKFYPHFLCQKCYKQACLEVDENNKAELEEELQFKPYKLD